MLEVPHLDRVFVAELDFSGTLYISESGSVLEQVQVYSDFGDYIQPNDQSGVGMRTYTTSAVSSGFSLTEDVATMELGDYRIEINLYSGRGYTDATSIGINEIKYYNTYQGGKHILTPEAFPASRGVVTYSDRDISSNYNNTWNRYTNSATGENLHWRSNTPFVDGVEKKHLVRDGMVFAYNPDHRENPPDKQSTNINIPSEYLEQAAVSQIETLIATILPVEV